MFKTSLNNSLLNCDVLCVLSSCLRYNNNEYLDKLEVIVKNAKKTIFFDISDSAGVLYEKAFEIFDYYYKKQIYLDKSIYTDCELKDPRLHVNKYIGHKNKHSKSISMNYSHLNLSDIDRIKISWNVGIGDYRTFISEYNYFNHKILSLQTKIVGRKINIPCYKFRYQKKSIINRAYDIISCFNLYEDERNNEISLHRKQTLKIIESLKSKYSVITGFLPKHKYYKLLYESKIGISPFGWGEITWKDFEIFMNGSILFKPDISHLDTWPDYFINNKTYIPYEWDAENLHDLIERTFNNFESRNEIALYGQENFKRYNVVNDPHLFINRFKSIFN